MSKKRPAKLLIAVLALAAPAALADDDERAAILAVVDRAYEAIRTQDNEIWREILLPDGINLSFRPSDQGGEPDQMGVRTFKYLLANPIHDEHQYVERWTGEPTVLVHGPLAVVWGEYDFWIDDQFSHCGMTLLDFGKVDGEWKLVTFNYTVEPVNCPTDPSASRE